MGIFSFLTGKKPDPTVTQTATTKLGPEQQELFNLAFPMARQYAETPIQQFGGSGIAGFTSTEQQGMDAAKAAAGTQQGIADASTAALMRLLGAGPNAAIGLTEDQLGATPGREAQIPITPGQNPYIEQVAQNLRTASNQNLLEQQLPAVRSGAVQQGGLYSGGSTRQGIAEGLATGRTNQGLDAAIADMFFKTYQQDVANQLAQRGQDVTQRGQDVTMRGQGIDATRLIGDLINRDVTNQQTNLQLAPVVQGQQLAAADTLGTVGGLERAMNQAQLDEEIKKFYTGQALPLLQAQELLALVQGMPGASTVGATTGAVPPGPNKAMGALGGALTGAQVGSMFGPIGTGVGAIGGGLFGLLSGK